VLDEDACPQPGAGSIRLSPNKVVPVLEARALKEKEIMGGKRVLALVVHNIADIHADYAAFLKHPVALREGELHIVQVVIEAVKRAGALAATAHVKIGRVCNDELHGIVGQFGHPARVADYNEVGLFHAHIDRAWV